MITDRWQSDEALASEGAAAFKVLEPACLSCKRRLEGSLDSCEEYTSIPWEIAAEGMDCDFYKE